MRGSLFLRDKQSGRTLASCVVDGVFPGEDHLGDGHKGVPLLKQTLDDVRQGLRGMEGGVMEENDGAGLYLAGHPLGDLTGGEVLPVQTVHVPYPFKELSGNGF